MTNITVKNRPPIVSSGIEALATAVIMTALRKARECKTMDAASVRWFSELADGFVFWCDVAGVDAEAMRTRIMRRLER